MGDYDPHMNQGRAGWKTWHAYHLEQEREARERFLQRRREYQAVVGAECAHGARELIIGGSGACQWMGLACPRGRCQMTYVDPGTVYREWEARQPSGAGA